MGHFTMLYIFNIDIAYREDYAFLATFNTGPPYQLNYIIS